MTKQSDAETPIILVPDPQVQTEFGGKTRQCLSRWDNDPKMAELGWPPPVFLRGKKHRARHLLEIFKTKLIADALRHRGKKNAKAAR
jgi:hypothetical protein